MSCRGGRFDGWSFGGHADAAVPWGSDGLASAQMLADADGYHVVLVRAQAGYSGAAHDHTHAEMTYVLGGTVVTNGRELGPGDACAAPAGSRHESFAAVTDAVYLSIFKL